MSKVRVLRVLEYSGELDNIHQQLQNSLPDGTRSFGPGPVTLRVATVGGIQGFELIGGAELAVEEVPDIVIFTIGPYCLKFAKTVTGALYFSVTNDGRFECGKTVDGLNLMKLRKLIGAIYA